MCERAFYKTQCKWKAVLLSEVQLNHVLEILFIIVTGWVQDREARNLVRKKKKKLSLECFLETLGFNHFVVQFHIVEESLKYFSSGGKYLLD